MTERRIEPDSSRPVVSLLIPTRGRPQALTRLLDSMIETADQPEKLEVVLAVDGDDGTMYDFAYGKLPIRTVSGPPGRTMGRLNGACLAAATGDNLMLLNDDVVVRSRGWDSALVAALDRHEDSIAMAHVDDGMFGDRLCPFPAVTRRVLDIVVDLVPEGYRRYRIDDHVQSIFFLLAVAGHARRYFCQGVIFEHLNFRLDEENRKVVGRKFPDAEAADEALFMATHTGRIRAALALAEAVTVTDTSEAHREMRLRRAAALAMVPRLRHALAYDTLARALTGRGDGYGLDRALQRLADAGVLTPGDPET